MTIYVDPAVWPYRNMIMCHCWSDTDSVEELFAMVDAIGVQRKWIQGHPVLSIGKAKAASWLHFDIASTKRTLAIKHGAVETDRYGPMEHTAKQLIATGRPNLVEIGERRLALVTTARQRAITSCSTYHTSSP